MRRLLGALAVIIALMGAPAASAATVTYNFSGNFDPPATGSFTGSVTFDNVTGITSAATVNVTAGKAADGVTDLPAGAYSFANYGDVLGFTFAGAIPASGERGGWMRFLGGTHLTTPTPQPDLLVDSQCLSADCIAVDGDQTSNRESSSVSFILAPPPPAPVPAMTEWAMILFGLMLAGGAALHLGRRRMV